MTRTEIRTQTRSDRPGQATKSAFAVRWPLSAVAAWASCAVLAASALAQSGATYSITKWTIDSGGGRATSASYTVTGTVGQHDADDPSGPTYSILGGFWSASPVAAADPPVLPAAPHEIRKNRYVSINPNNPGAPTIIKVELANNTCTGTGKRCVGDSDCKVCLGGTNNGNACNINSDCPGGGTCDLSGETCDADPSPTLLGYVGAPESDAFGNAISVVLDAQPAARTFTETVIHIGDCEIRPDRTYAISVATQAEPGLFSTPLHIGTTDKPQGKDWADVVGSFDGVSWSAPNYLVNVDDVVSFVKFVTNKPAPHRTVLDLLGDGPTYLNNVINAGDLQMILQGFVGKTYPPSAYAGYPANLVDCSGN